MELRKLKSLLGALRDAGVTSYRDADVTLQFGPTFAPVPDGDVEMGAAETEKGWAAGAPLALADAHRRILNTYATKVGKVRS